jgi:hypothetical protein
VDTFGRRSKEPRDIDAALRAARATPRDAFVREVAGSLRSAGGSRGRLRLGFAAALTIAMLTALAAVGGLGYASSATTHTFNAVKHVVVKSKQTKAHVPTLKQSAAQDQYRPGCGLGDKNHIHTGPPGQGGVCPAHGH